MMARMIEMKAHFDQKSCQFHAEAVDPRRHPAHGQRDRQLLGTAQTDRAAQNPDVRGRRTAEKFGAGSWLFDEEAVDVVAVGVDQQHEDDRQSDVLAVCNPY